MSHIKNGSPFVKQCPLTLMWYAQPFGYVDARGNESVNHIALFETRNQAVLALDLWKIKRLPELCPEEK